MTFSIASCHKYLDSIMTVMPSNSFIQYTILLFLMTSILTVLSQDNIFTITPNVSVCVGESVVITCYLFPPTPNGYLAFALLSFNGSTPEEFGDINAQFGSIGYMATTAIPILGDSSRIQLTITSFQVSDSNTEFSCHTQLSSDGSPTGTLESGNATLAGPVNLSPATSNVSFELLEDLTISTNITHDMPLERSDTVVYSYTLHYNSSQDIISTPDTSTSFTTKFSIDTCYRISVTAENCAGSEGIVYSKYFNIPGVSAENGEFQILSTNPTLIEWVYTNQTCGSDVEYDTDYISKEFFTFSLWLNGALFSNITDFTLNADGFTLTLEDLSPSDLTNGDYVLRIEYFGTISDIPIIIEETRSNTVTIILIVLFVLLVILLLIILTITVIFVLIYLKRKADSNK